MDTTSQQLPDNLLSRLTRAYVASREFTGDDGKVVKYKRLVLAGTINDEEIEIELKADKKDLTLISLFRPQTNPLAGDE